MIYNYRLVPETVVKTGLLQTLQPCIKLKMTEWRTWINPTGNECRVSNTGFVERRVKDEWIRTGKCKRSTYFTIGGRHNQKRWNLKVHRIVATVWIPNPDNLPQVDHIDGDRENNHVSNLRWVTALQNLRNRIGKKGYWQVPSGRYAARIKFNGRVKYIGTYDTPEQAHAAYIAAKRIYHPECIGRLS